MSIAPTRPSDPVSLREPEPSLRATLDTALDAAILMDADGVIRLWNRKAEAMFGWSEAEVIGRRLSEAIIPERSRSLHDRALAHYQAGGEGRLVNRRNEMTARRRDGVEFSIELTIAPISHDGVNFFSAFVRDISEHRTAADQLKFQSIILSNVRDSIVVTDLTGRIQFWNRGAEEVYGYLAEEVLGESILTLYDEEEATPERLAADLQKMLGGEDSAREWRRRRKDGSIVWIDSKRVVLRNPQGEAIGFLGVGRDITERRRVTEALEVSHEQLRDLGHRLRGAREQERAVIARRIHDELGQVLTALLMDMAWMESRLSHRDGPLLEKCQSMSALIQSAIGRVRDLASELRPAVLDSLGLAAAIEWETQQFTRRTGILCTLELPAEPIVLDTDHSTDVFRILQEALTNVVRHARAHQVDVRLGSWRGQLELRVGDDGRGITDAEISSPLAHGLRGMRERALMWNGTIDIEPRPARGTVVVLRLPLTDSNRKVT